jgi:imidazolonepropionase-like amidohydrolase
MTRFTGITLAFAALLLLMGIAPAIAQGTEEEPPPQILIKNVRVWDGTSSGLSRSTNVLIEGNLVKSLSPSASVRPGETVIDGGGRTLMPGLIDMHSHLCFRNGLMEFRDGYDTMANGAYVQIAMQDYLDQGFTTARDAGCNLLGIAKGVNNGMLPGPRLFPSGGFLSQTGGHADLGYFSDTIDGTDALERAQVSYVVDGVPEVMEAARQNLRRGATQIKVMAGGGVSSEFDPLHITQFSLEEMKAIVGVAEDYGTYVLAHAYHDRSVNRAIDAGVKVIEHGFLISEETVQRMVAEDVVLSVQAQASLEAFGNVEEIDFFTADQKAKGAAVNAGAKQMLSWAIEHGVKMVLGGDMFGPDVGRQADNLIWFNELANDNLLTLRSSTSTSAEVLALSGGMNPYKDAYPGLSAEERAQKGIGLGVIEAGAYADVILVDGNPLEDLAALKRDHVRVVVKDGKVYKNTLDAD